MYIMCNNYFLQFRYAFYSLNTISITKIFCQAISFCSSIRRLSLFFRNKLRCIIKIKHKVFVHMKYSKITKSFLAHCGTKIVLYHFHCRKRSLYRCGGGLQSYQNKSYLIYIQIQLAISDLLRRRQVVRFDRF